ncbi:MAG: DUF1232 domain-containing protein [Mesorhizobium sp.]|uniref:YkvA family protein n=1 Tax=Mesorhizobium sp. TaxID=1871066 RepID=UPI000FE78E64|nr:YkvA family protein [Mesorhizobium sp.]RWJ21133.1 MAG: DUF1232 domain-containing protein [Mesorhizobium sp.]
MSDSERSPRVAAFGRLRTWARGVKRDVQALYLAAKDPRVPWYAKAMALFVVGYALSPIDLIPDFIPILGYLDDLIILPLAILLAVKLIPPEILAEHRASASASNGGSGHRLAAAVIVLIWLALGLLVLSALLNEVGP